MGRLGPLRRASKRAVRLGVRARPDLGHFRATRTSQRAQAPHAPSGLMRLISLGPHADGTVQADHFAVEHVVLKNVLHQSCVVLRSTQA